MAVRTKDRWHVGKEIPIVVILTMLAQFGTIVWFAAKMDNRIDVNSAAITRNLAKIQKTENNIDALEAALARQNVINARLDVTMQNISKTLESVDRHMEVVSGR